MSQQADIAKKWTEFLLQDNALKDRADNPFTPHFEREAGGFIEKANLQNTDISGNLKPAAERDRIQKDAQEKFQAQKTGELGKTGKAIDSALSGQMPPPEAVSEAAKGVLLQVPKNPLQLAFDLPGVLGGVFEAAKSALFNLFTAFPAVSNAMNATSSWAWDRTKNFAMDMGRKFLPSLVPPPDPNAPKPASYNDYWNAAETGRVLTQMDTALTAQGYTQEEKDKVKEFIQNKLALNELPPPEAGAAKPVTGAPNPPAEPPSVKPPAVVPPVKTSALPMEHRPDVALGGLPSPLFPAGMGQQPTRTP